MIIFFRIHTAYMFLSTE